MDVKTVFFDAGSTLIYPDPPVGDVYARALRRAGIRADGGEVQRQFERTWRRSLQRRSSGNLGYGSTESEGMDWWRRVVRDSFAPFGQPADFEEVFVSLWDHFASRAAWRIYEDVLPTLDALDRAGVRAGLISNWDVRLVGLLDELRLRERLQWVVISCQVGAEKPGRAIFQRALDECSLPPENVAHVGDSYTEDVTGARAAGLHAVWLRRGQDSIAASSEIAVPDDVAVITSLAELLDVLA